MAHFAKVENGVVREVIVVSNSDCLDENGNEKEAIGQAFIAACGIPGYWVQTSYNGNPIEGQNRGKYATIGDVYDPVTNVFLPRPID